MLYKCPFQIKCPRLDEKKMTDFFFHQKRVAFWKMGHDETDRTWLHAKRACGSVMRIFFRLDHLGSRAHHGGMNTILWVNDGWAQRILCSGSVSTHLEKVVSDTILVLKSHNLYASVNPGATSPLTSYKSPPIAAGINSKTIPSFFLRALIIVYGHADLYHLETTFAARKFHYSLQSK